MVNANAKRVAVMSLTDILSDWSASFDVAGLDHNGSTLLFRLIVAHVAELTRPLDEVALPARAFLNGCGLVAKLVDFTVRHLGSFGRALVSASGFGGLRWRGGRKRLLKYPADRLGPGWSGFLIGDPGV
jgi:hypothetical protein